MKIKLNFLSRDIRHKKFGDEKGNKDEDLKNLLNVMLMLYEKI
jgi:hypothetical protein